MTNLEEKVEEIDVECPHCKTKHTVWIRVKANSEVKTELQIEQN